MLSERPLKFRWRLGILAALAVTVLSFYPQLDLWRDTPSDLGGPYVTLEFDEVAYSAYLNSLIEGGPRRSDPFERPDAKSTQAETLFSIQFLPPYVLAVPARILGLGASTMFILLGPIAAFLTALALFWLIASVTSDDRLAAVGVLLIMCLASFAGTPLALRMLLKMHNPFPYLPFLPFLRRYVPAVPFPFYLAFCVFVWRMLTTRDRRVVIWQAAAAGLVVAILVYSYFYLWTAAAAWLLCVTVLWLAAWPKEWRRIIRPLSLIAGLALAALIPYAILLSHRAANTDTMLVIKTSHFPEFFRQTELIGALIIMMLAIAIWKRLIDWRDPRSLFAASFALLPFVVFNQQILTGVSMQPGHYEKLITNYSVLIGFVIAVGVIRHGWKTVSSPIPGRVLIAVAIATLGWGFAETVTQTHRNKSINLMRVQERRLAVRLKELALNSTPTSAADEVVIFSPKLLRVHADSLPTDAAQAPFWAPHAFVFKATWPQYKERLFQNLYYMGVDEQKMNLLVNDKSGYIKFILIAYQTQPISAETIPREIGKYLDYTASFDQQQAATPNLHYLVTEINDDVDLSNLDRWYERDGGEHVGDLLLYRLKLRARE